MRLRTRRGRWRGSYIAVSEPYTDEVGETVIRVAKEGECWATLREGRRNVGTPWPVRQIEVILPLAWESERTKELPKEPDGAEPRSWWQRMFGGG